jgi:hypothetical protein
MSTMSKLTLQGEIPQRAMVRRCGAGPDAMHKNDVHRTKMGPTRYSLVIYNRRRGVLEFVRVPWQAVPVPTGCPLLSAGTVLKDGEADWM